MVYVILADGFEEAEALTPVDLLRRAGLQVQTAGLDNISVTGAHGINVNADITIDDICFDDLKMLVLPGGRGYARIGGSEKARRLISKTYEEHRLIGAICAAPTILAEMGLLEGVKATCFPPMKDQMNGALWQDSPAVNDGNIITGKAAGCAVEFSLMLIEKLLSKDAADKVKREIYFEHL